MTQSTELTAGAGFTFEDSVSASYLASLLVEETGPGLGGRIVERVALQQASFGEPLDDLIVDARATDNSIARLSLQVKNSITISAANSNTDFREVVTNSWKTLKKENFRRGIDRYGFAVGNVANQSFRTLRAVCEWARASSSQEHFTQRFEEKGNSSAAHKAVNTAIKSILTDELGRAPSHEELHQFFAHFVGIKFDFLHEGETTPAQLIGQLRVALLDADKGRASDLWDALRLTARIDSGNAVEFSRHSLLNSLKGRFQLRGSPSAQADLQLLQNMAVDWLKDVACDIGGVRIKRNSVIETIKSAVRNHKFVQIGGLPGTGKSSILRMLVEEGLDKGPVLFLKSDRLTGRSWQEFATSIGLQIQDVVSLLTEIGAVGSPYLFIDGIDRIEPAQQKVVLDVIRAIFQSETLSEWRIIVTARNAGIEPLRNWLPHEIFASGGIGSADIKPFDDSEATELASMVPALHSLLFGPKRVREIARRPFFASVLARELTLTDEPDDFKPQSEVDLIKRWWMGGGYDASDTTARQRQRALIDLAHVSAQRLGRPIPVSQINDATIELLSSFISDGILRDVDVGHTITFSHDIFFEWAYFHLLIDSDDQWMDAIVDAGEPPILGRVVELLSQSKFVADAEWSDQFTLLDRSGLRGQWMRAWLLAPLGTPNFDDGRSEFEKATDADDFQRLGRLLVWFQAERTAPNPFVLDGTLITAGLDKNEIVRIADTLGWPSDFSTWARLITWLLDRIDTIPHSLIPDMLSIFEVWQNAFADIDNTLSSHILQQSLVWLEDIEAVQHPDHFSMDQGRWSQIKRDDLKDLESALRILILRAAKLFPDGITQYLNRVSSNRHVRNHVFAEIVQFSTILSQTHPDALAKIARREFMEELPEEQERREQKEREAHFDYVRQVREKPESERTRQEQMALSSMSPFISGGSSYHDWERLCIGRTHQGYFPASPLREPFHSLFQNSPRTALNLVSDITNHAITAWRQLHRLDHERRGTPIPICLSFPWGDQKFWGGTREYLWGRGWWGPQVVKCALLALEGWALQELDKGRAPGDVIEDVVYGHQSCSVLAISVAITLNKQHVSEVTLPLIACQRLWHADLQRCVSEHGNSSSSLIGFDNIRADKPHIEALTMSNQHPFRTMELRQLAPMFVFHPDSQINEASRDAIEQFPNDLPFTYEEERDNDSARKELNDTALIWAEWGKRDNYVPAPHPEDENHHVIQLDNPKTKEPHVQAAAESYAEMTRELALWNWVHNTFETGAVSKGMSLKDAVDLACEFYHPDVFQGRSAEGEQDLRLGSVAGTAAIVLVYRENSSPAKQQWAREVIQNAFRTPETSKHWFAGSLVPWHPCIFVARALASDIKADTNAADAKQQLMALAAHPLEQVSLEAIGQAFGCWDHDNRFSWSVLDLGMRLSIGSLTRGGQSAYGFDPAKDEESRSNALTAAMTEHFDRSGFAELTPPPPAWVFAPHEPRGDPFYDERLSSEPVWRDPDIFWRWDFAPKVLRLAPIEKIMTEPELREKFLELNDKLLDWTLDRIAPQWKEDQSDRPDRNQTELLEWRHQLSVTLAHVAGYLEASDVMDRYLSRIFELDDNLCMSFLSSFVDRFICVSVLDSPVILNCTLDVLEKCLDRLLQDRTFKRSGYRAGEVYGFDLPELIPALLFVKVEHAGGAVRFANGDWQDIDQVMSIIDKFVSEAGWISSVAGSFLKLCERSIECYPAEKFADQVLSILSKCEGTPPGWRGTILPARIAGLVEAVTRQDRKLGNDLAQDLLRILDALVDMGDRRSAALQVSETFKNIRLQ